MTHERDEQDMRTIEWIKYEVKEMGGYVLNKRPETEGSRQRSEERRKKSSKTSQRDGSHRIQRPVLKNGSNYH